MEGGKNPDTPHQVTREVAHYSAVRGELAPCTVAHRGRNVLTKVSSKNHSAWNPFIEYSVWGCTVQAHECVGVHRDQNRTSGVFLYHYCLKVLRKGLSLT